MQQLSRSFDPLELRELAAATRRFAEEKLRVPSGKTPEYRADDFTKMGELGLAGMSLPEKFGGTECSNLAIAAVLYEIARAQLGPAIYLSVHLMVARLIAALGETAHGALLRELAAGKKLGAFCLTEPDAGSDAANLKTRAKRKDGGYVLNGEKIYITSAGAADVYLVFARTGEDGAKGISAFVIAKDTPGLSVGSAEKKMGCEGAPIASVSFSDCAVPESARLGPEGSGYKLALSGLNGGRINIAASACGIAARSLEIAAKHLAGRKQFGRALAEFQGLQFMAADLFTALEASMLLTRSAAEGLDRGEKENTAASMAKCFATDAAMKITTDGVQLLGGAGYLAEYEVERLMRDAKMLQIVEGTNQIQRLIIARALLTPGDTL